MRYLTALLLLPLLTILPAKPLYAWTVAEIRAMPPYCAGRYALHENPPEFKRWQATYGPDFIHTHHLCDGIGNLDRYYKASNQAEKRTVLKDAMGTLNYMIQHASPDFKLMPDVYLYRSQVFNLTNKPREAIADLRKAIGLDPKHVRAYTQVADYLERIGQRDEALKLVSEGLRHLPDSTNLQRVYAKLGGKQPYPEPYNTAVANTEIASTQKAQQLQEKKTVEPKLAVFDFSKILGGGGNVLKEAGAYFFVEVREDPSSPDSKVRFKIISRIPQPATRIEKIGIDMGRYSDLFTTIQVNNDALFSKYYPLQRNGGAFTHPFWQGFRTTYLATFTKDVKERKTYDPSALPPGGSLTLVATLNRGKRIEDVIEAMKRGIQSSDGLRFGIFLYHTKGVRPNPGVTIMDDGGFATGGLRQLTGFDEEQAAAESTGTDQSQTPAGNPQGVPPAVAGSREQRTSQSPSDNDNDNKNAGERAPDTANKQVIGTPSNPWCRFCPPEPGQ